MPFRSRQKMGATDPETRYHHGDLRQSLIDAALKLIAEKQDAKTLSLREVARRVGVSHAAPYRHFADKEALLAAVAEEGFHILTRHLQESMKPLEDDPLGQLQASGVAYVKFAIAHPSHYRVMFSALQPNNPNYPALNAAGDEAFAVMVGAIAHTQTLGLVKPGDPRQLARITWSLVHGLAMLLIEGQLPLTDSEVVTTLAQQAAAALVYGLRQDIQGN
ncbi:MAG: TetR/AcrR family transcriptional regulator [Synechococcales bacterium]|nr:TetR/AcrR family transcriptional regulator [Synechococcales bacterium]